MLVIESCGNLRYRGDCRVAVVAQPLLAEARARLGHDAVVRAVRQAVEEARGRVLAGEVGWDDVSAAALAVRTESILRVARLVGADLIVINNCDLKTEQLILAMKVIEAVKRGAKVIAIKEDGKIDLSIKALQDPQPRMERRRGNDPGFEQMLRKFLRSSEERQVDVKRSIMHKRK